jgi:hypothetical protein
VRSSADLYAALLRLYPRAFRAQFGEEMQSVFGEALTEAAEHGRAEVFLMREWRDALPSLAAAYAQEWMKQWREIVRRVGEVVPTADLPLPPPDGRESWRQTGLELSLFLAAGLSLMLVTYVPMAQPEAGWEHHFEMLGKVITPLTLPLFLIGLARGLPRWAYPFGGLLLSYGACAAHQSGLTLFLIVLLLASAILAGMAINTLTLLSPLPIPLRRIGQSLALDWTRLSFGVYGGMPLAIIFAFDDAHFNNRTPYMAVAALVMVAGALIYCRSRQRTWQIAALLAGTSFSIWAAWLDRVSFASGLGNWIVAPLSRAAELAWLLNLWLPWVILILTPTLLILAGRTVSPRRTA